MMLRLLLGLGLLLAFAATALFTVDRAELAYVSRFGALVSRYDGATDAGLHLKWPWPIEAVIRLDRRLQSFDLPPVELPTNDPRGRTVDKMLVGDAYVCWRIPDAEAGDQFLRSVGTPDRARLLLSQRVSSRLSSVVSTLPLESIVQVAEGDAVTERAETLRKQLLGRGPEGESEDLTASVRADYGVELVDIRLRRFNYPSDVRPAIAERIKAERFRKAADYESEADRKAAEILSEADREAAVIRSTAIADRRRRERQADAAADAIRNEAHKLDPAFYGFLRQLEAYQTMLGETRDVLLLSARHELFRLLLNPPAAPETPANTPTTADAVGKD